MIPAGVAMVAASLLAGWIGLWPLRGRLGPLGYHVVAGPVGLLGWTWPAGVALVLSTGYRWWFVWPALLAYAGALFAWSLALSHREPAARPVPSWTFAAAAAGFLGAAWAAAALGAAAYSADGWSQYELFGLRLHDLGLLSNTMLGHRMVLPLAVHAANRFLGGDFTYVVFPMMGLWTALMLGAGLMGTAFRRLRPVWAFVASSAVTLLMATTASYLFHSVFMHSHMYSAMYLLGAVLGIQRSFDAESPPSGAWLTVGGLCAAGFFLARPDGPAYVFVPVALLAALMLRHATPVRRAYDFVVPLLAPMTVGFGATLVIFGVWESDKLKAETVLTFAALYGIAPALVWVVRRVPGLGAWMATGTNALKLAGGANIVGLTYLFARHTDTFVPTLVNQFTNLVNRGGYHSMWVFAAGLVGLSFAMPETRRADKWTPYVLYALLQFFAIAMAVHGLNQPGRLGWGDSFNRLAFHAVPFVYWFGGMLAGAVLAPAPAAEEA